MKRTNALSQTSVAVAFAMCSASFLTTPSFAQSKSRVENNTSDVKAENVTLNSVGANASAGAFKFKFQVGSSGSEPQVAIGDLTACGDAVIANNHLKADLKNVNVTSTGSIRIASIRAGC